MNNFKSILFILVVSVFFNSLVLAEHLKGKSKAEKDGYLKVRIIDLPAAFKKVQISPASTVKTLNKELIENKNTKKIDKNIFTKSGLMVGLGENKDEILQVMDDLRSAEVDFLTIGQYLQPSVKHYPLDRYYNPDEFKELEIIAKSKGFLLVSSSPLTRSSYHADEDFVKLQEKRIKQTNVQSIS